VQLHTRAVDFPPPCESAASQYRVGLLPFESGRVLVFHGGVLGCSSRMNGKPSSPVLRGLGASNGARPLDHVAQRFLTVKVTSCFARGFIQGAANFTQYVADGYFGIVKRRKPPLYPYARHSEILQFQRLIVPIHQPEMDPVLDNAVTGDRCENASAVPG